MILERRFVIVIAALFVLGAQMGGIATADESEAKDINFGKMSSDFGKTSLVPNPKIASNLYQVLDLYQKNPAEVKKITRKAMAGDKDIKSTFGIGINENNEIAVAIKLYEYDEEILKGLEKAGIEVLSSIPEMKKVYTYLSHDEITNASQLPQVKKISLPEAVVYHKGSITPKSDFYLQTDQVRAQFNYEGTGVKVGIISDGMNYTEDSVRDGDLPAFDDPYLEPPPSYYPGSNIKFNTFVSDETLDASDLQKVRIGEEGTAMMEIVHDLAPKATLLFCNFDPYLPGTFNQAKDWLASEGCDIICDDIGWLGVGNLDGTSIVSLKSTELVRAGHLYYTAVGNMAQSHYGGYFTDDPLYPNKIHNYVFDPANNRYDETIEARVYPGGVLAFYLWWYEPWDYASDDIDLYILDSQSLDFNNPIAYSTDIQNGDDEPFEAAGVINLTGDTAVVSVVIVRKHEDLTPRRLDLFVYGWGEMLEHIVPETSMVNNNEAGGGVMSIGAIDVNSARRLTVEDFSSRGPTLDGRIKPEMANYDGVPTGVPGFESFYGTSAAAPHAAGVAALLHELLPSASPDEINSFLRYFCDDLAPAGLDNISGSGRMIAYPVFDSLINTGWTNRVKTYNFDDGTEGWENWAPPGFTAPQFTWQPGNLVMTARSNINTFGYWVSPVVEFLPDNSINLIADRLYQARLRIWSNAGPTDFPTFRVRVHSTLENEIAQKVFNSSNGNGIYPLPEGRYYYVYFRPDQESIDNGIRLAVDMINFDQSDSATASLYVDEVQVMELNLPY